MCKHLSTLGCEEGKPVYNSDLGGPVGVPNQSCVDFCQELQDSGYFVNPKCVLLVTRCDEVEEHQLLDPASCYLPEETK